MTIREVWKSLALSLALGAFGWAYGADEPEAPKSEEASIAKEESEDGQVSDPAFDQYVDMKLLGIAYSKLDPAGLTDGALQLAEGERVLKRSHKGMKAADVLEAAIRLASQKGDKASLERIAKHAQATNNQALSARITSLLQLAAVPRAAGAELKLEDGSEEENRIAELVRQDVEGARLEGGAAKIDDITEFVKAVRKDNVISEGAETALLKYLSDVKKDIPSQARPSSAATLDSALAALSASSRGANPVTAAGTLAISIPKNTAPPLRNFLTESLYDCSGQAVRLIRSVPTGVSWNKDAIGAKALAIAKATKSGGSFAWDDKWYKRTLSPSNGEILLLMAHNQKVGNVIWVAVKNTPSRWMVMWGDGQTFYPSNNEQIKRSVRINGWLLDFDVKNPNNSGGYTANDILFGFGY